MEIWEGSELVEGRRKSARILALKEVKKNKEISKSKDNVGRENRQTPVAAKTAASGAKRGRKRKKLENVVLSSQQVVLSLPYSYIMYLHIFFELILSIVYQ